jgi:hypothetical protein
MAYALSQNQVLSSSAWGASYGVSVTGSQLQSVSETVADSATFDLTMAIDVSAIVGIIIVASRAATFTCNSGANTVNLVAGVPYVWTTSSYNTNKLTVDATAIHVANASGGSLTFDMQIVSDATP